MTVVLRKLSSKKIKKYGGSKWLRAAKDTALKLDLDSSPGPTTNSVLSELGIIRIPSLVIVGIIRIPSLVTVVRTEFLNSAYLIWHKISTR